MVDIAQRLCTPDQAMRFQEKGVLQKTQYAWCKDGDDWFLEYVAPEGFPTVEDWSKNHPNCYAAFDNTDLGLMLASLGFFPSGPTYPLPGETNENFRWWCDDINTIQSVEDALYQGYGATEAQAKANMLLKLLDLGRPSFRWKYYNEDRLLKLRSENKNYGKPYNDDITDETA